ncbi:amino acid permease [Myroides marinus]|uniref:APC family permease n=1 Tax=Myroides marinus TaxID=703342 RepID=UPI002578B51E|nr:amino acid permease [Myroides marinus]MDM1405733.1 amino acid permease [Myroides marinus]
MVNEKNRISLFTGVLIVIANMIGISAFSNLGIQLMYQTSYIEVILVWILGALIALCGALSYAEVVCIYPENGGEYSFLSKMYNPTIGFLAGWISITVGFPVSIALSAKVYASYFFADADQMFIASGIVIATTILHFLGYNSSMVFQKIVTLTIVIVFIGLITFGLISPSKSALYDNYSTINYAQDNLKVIKNFVIALIFISYSYTGWNSVTYMVADFKKPSRTIPRILFIGTLFVGICYVLLQVVLLKHLKYDELKGSLNVVMTFVNKLSDGQYTVVIKGFITLLFISSISIMTWVGSKVLYQMTIKSNTFSCMSSN